jgi:hypothetical protein
VKDSAGRSSMRGAKIRDAKRPDKIFLLCLLALLLFPGGCAGGKSVVRAPEAPLPPSGPRVAVAPMENRSNDLDASEIIRAAFAEQIARQGWNVMPTPESDRLLREALGISYGGQLSATTPEEVCRALGVEGIFYGEVREWNKTTTGLYNSVSVVAAFTLYRTDGSRAWEENDRQFRRHLPRGAGREIGGEIIGGALVNLLMNPMTPYGMAAGRNIAKKLPAGALDASVAEPAPQSEPPEGGTHPGKTGGDE